MNDQITKLLTDLANKLGTTAEYLWGVLVRQAAVDGVISIIQNIVIVLFIIAVYKIHKFLGKSIKEGGDYSRYDEYEALVGVPMIIAGITCAFFCFCFLCNIHDIITDFINPEYYALHQLLPNHN